MCKNEHCSKQNATCLADSACAGNMTCVPACYWPAPSEDSSTCFIECQQAMAANNEYVDLIRCWGEHYCQESRPKFGGSCRATHAREGVQQINDLGKMEGVWWAVMSWGWACGDTSKCRMSNISEASLLQCFDAKKNGSWITVKEQSQLTLVGPGIIRSTKIDTKPDPFETLENHIVDYDDSYQLHIWCGGNQDVTFNGALVVSRNRNISSINNATLDRFKANVTARGYDPADNCTFDNTDCTECTN